MKKKITINPLARVHSPTTVEVIVEKNKVVNARCIGDFFRGFEMILRDRDPRDAPYFTQRICGICSASHGNAASMALESAAKVRPPRNGNILRNIILGADFLQNHIRHFYMFSMPDYVRMPDIGPLTSLYKSDYRLSQKTNDRVASNYFKAIEISRIANEIISILGGKTPFSHGMLAGGSVVPPTVDITSNIGFKLNKISEFIDNYLIPDMEAIGKAYQDYYQIGVRKENMLTFGLFPKDEGDRDRVFPMAAVIEGELEKVDLGVIKEHVHKSWFTRDSMPTKPSFLKSEPDREKKGAYSWIKAPRYGGRSLEGGPLARLWVRGDYRQGVSTMHRKEARVRETKMIVQLMQEWLRELHPERPVFKAFKIPDQAEGTGLTDAMRGPLGHWLQIKKGRISHYDIITPTTWNFSPRDSKGQKGPVEEALIGTPVENYEEPVEVGRVIRAFDLCSSCSAHVITPRGKVKNIVLMP